MAQFKEGESGNPNGKPKGAKNKKTTQWEMFADYCLNEGLKKYEEELNKLTGKDYVNAINNLLEFHKPKLSRSTIDGGTPIKHEITTVRLTEKVIPNETQAADESGNT